MDTLDLFQRLGLAFAIGLLFGLERGWQERADAEGSRTAGIRTFALIGLLGGVCGAMTPMLGAVPLGAALIALALAFALFYWREMSARGEYSVTSVVVALLDFSLGAFAVLGNMAAAGAACVAAVALLAARPNLHEFLRKLTWPELRSGVLLLAMTFILLPILPDRPLDPWAAFNPHELWLMTVLIAVVCFTGYAGVRLLGEKSGLLLSSAVGALVSSTTVTVNNARLAHNASGGGGILAAAICIAWMVSIVRMTAIAVAINLAMLRPLAFPVLSAAIVLGLAMIVFQRRPGKDTGAKPAAFENPLDLGFVLRFGALLSAITVAAHLANRNLGEGGVLTLAGVSGLVDVDPIMLSVSQLAGGTLSIAEAADAILLAALANMVTKMTAATAIGGWRFGLPLAAAGIAAIAAGAACRFLIGL
jgi:uncharacterized membrane protein (DUF4010 family)